MRPKISPFISLKNKQYSLFLLGFFVSQMGNQMQIVAVNWQIYQLTHSPFALGIVGLAGFFPLLFFSIFGGLTADRMDRKMLLLITQLVMVVLSLILAVATFEHVATPALIYIILALNATTTAFFSPVRQSVIPNLVKRPYLMNAISLNSLTRQSAIVIGPAIAGFMIAFKGVEGVYFFNAISFLIMVATILPLKIPAHELSKRASYSLFSILEGIKFVKNSSIISSTMMLDTVATFFGSATTLIPIFAQDILGVSAQGLGALYAATSVGGVLAGLALSTLHKIEHQGKIILIAVLVYGLATIGFGLSKSFYLSLFLLAIVGAGDMVSTILRNTIRQSITPDHIRGRMMGINILFAQGGPKLGDAEAGILAALTGAPTSVVIGGIGTILATLILAAAVPKLRNFNKVSENPI